MGMFNITSVDAFAMARCTAAPIDLTNKPRRRLEAIVRQHSAPQSLLMRARIILLGADGAGVRETAEQLGLGRATVQRWRAGWGEQQGQDARGHDQPPFDVEGSAGGSPEVVGSHAPAWLPMDEPTVASLRRLHQSIGEFAPDA